MSGPIRNTPCIPDSGRPGPMPNEQLQPVIATPSESHHRGASHHPLPVPTEKKAAIEPIFPGRCRLFGSISSDLRTDDCMASPKTGSNRFDWVEKRLLMVRRSVCHSKSLVNTYHIDKLPVNRRFPAGVRNRTLRALDGVCQARSDRDNDA
jgi:hypothetical protein